MGSSCRNPGAWRRGAAPRLALAVGAAFAGAALFNPELAAMSPVPFFQRVERVGLLCSLDPASPDPGPERAGGLDEAALCERAAAELRALLGSGGPPVAVFGRNDERIADPNTLLVLLHASLRSLSPAEGGTPDGKGAVLALSAAPHRARTGNGRPGDGAPPFFIAPPQAVAVPDGTPDGAALRNALRRLLTGIARPLLTNR